MNLTEGQKRVRASFNPSDLKRVADFKSITASAIDAIEKVEKEVKEAPATIGHDDMGGFLREAATAKTQLQIASMCGVLALTHGETFKHLLSTTVTDVEPEPIVESTFLDRVIDEQYQLDVKVVALHKFINSANFDKLNDINKSLLKDQIEAMRRYSTILKGRITAITLDE